MEKEFKKGDKIFHTRLKKYGIFVAYSKYRDDEAAVNLFYGDNSEEDMFVVSVCLLKKAETKEVEIKEDKVHYEVFWKFYINNNKNLKGIKKEIFNTENEAIEYLKTKRDGYGVNWIKGNVVEIKSKEIFTL